MSDKFRVIRSNRQQTPDRGPISNSLERRSRSVVKKSNNIFNQFTEESNFLDIMIQDIPGGKEQLEQKMQQHSQMLQNKQIGSDFRFSDYYFQCSYKQIKRLLLSQSVVLNSKFKKRLQDAFDELHQITQNLAQKNFEIENNEDVVRLNNEIETFKRQIQTSKRQCRKLQYKMNKFNQRVDQSGKYLGKMSDKLKQLNQSNIKLSYEIDLIKEKSLSKDFSREKLPPIQQRSIIMINQKLPQINWYMLNEDQRELCEQNIQEYDNYRDEITQIKSNIQSITNLQGTFVYEQKKLETFFLQCFQAGKQHLIKSQVKPQNTSGLAGSLYFQLINRPNALNSITPNQSDLDGKSVVFNTLQQMVRRTKKLTRQEMLTNVKIDLKDFQNLSSLQLLGLMIIKSDIFEKLHQETFPANLLHQVSNTEDSLSKSIISKQNMSAELNKSIGPRKIRSEANLLGYRRQSHKRPRLTKLIH